MSLKTKATFPNFLDSRIKARIIWQTGISYYFYQYFGSNNNQICSVQVICDNQMAVQSNNTYVTILIFELIGSRILELILIYVNRYIQDTTEGQYYFFYVLMNY